MNSHRKDLRNSVTEWRSTKHQAAGLLGNQVTKSLKPLGFFARLAQWLGTP